MGRYRNSAVPGERAYASLYAGNYISEDEGLAFFYLDELDAALEELNNRVIARHERNPLFRRFVGVATGSGSEVPVETVDSGDGQTTDKEV